MFRWDPGVHPAIIPTHHISLHPQPTAAAASSPSSDSSVSLSRRQGSGRGRKFFLSPTSKLHQKGTSGKKKTLKEKFRENDEKVPKLSLSQERPWDFFGFHIVLSKCVFGGVFFHPNKGEAGSRRLRSFGLLEVRNEEKQKHRTVHFL